MPTLAAAKKWSFQLILLLPLLVLTACAAGVPVPQNGTSGERPDENPPPDLSIEEIIGKDLETGENRVLQIALNLLGTPYRFGGTTPAGFDCSGLVWYVFNEAGISVPRSSEEQYHRTLTVDISLIRPGDLLFFRTSARKVSHVGIYAEDNLFIHAPSSGKEVSLAKLDSPYWSSRLVKAGRFP